MSNYNPLSLDFLHHRAEAAAAVLQTLDAVDAAAYLEEVPVRILLPVINAMEIWPAAGLLRQMALPRCATILGGMPYQDAVAILRIIGAPHSQQVLASLPAGLAKSFRNSMAYQSNTVGAWMDMSTPYFQRSMTAAQCLQLLGSQQQRFGSNVTVIDQHHRLYGVVELDALLVDRGDSPLEQLADTSVAAISAEMSLQVVKGLDSWHRYSVLPVRDKHFTYLGTLSRLGLSTALSKQQPAGHGIFSRPVIGHVAKAMAVSVSGLLQMGAGHSIDWQRPESGGRDEQ